MSEDFSVVVIARNEEKTLPRLIESLEGVEDIVILDTGSTDNTVEVASEMGARVECVGDRFIEIPTQEDIETFISRYGFEPSFTTESKLFNYAAARNYAMTLAKNDFCFQPDCDEIVDWDLEKVKVLLPNCDQLSYRFCFAHAPDGSPLLEFTHCKFFRRSKGKWVKKVHEVVSGVSNRILWTDEIYLHHWQQKNDNRSNMLPKLEYAILETENDDRNTYYLAREYYYNSDFEHGVPMFEAYFRLPGWKPERSQGCIYVGHLHKWHGKLEEAYEWYHRALMEDDSRREPFVALADTLLENGRTRSAVAYYKAALEIPFNPNYYLNDMSLYGWMLDDKLSILYDKLGEEEKARYHWLEAVKHAPEDQRIINNAKWFYRKK